MTLEAIQQVLQTIQSAANSKPSAIEFEMAYQARVAADRIRSSIKQLETLSGHNGDSREVSFQLLDALQRLDVVDRRFQARSGTSLESSFTAMHAVPNGAGGSRDGSRTRGPDRDGNAA